MKKNNNFAIAAITSGIFLMLLSLLAYFKYNIGFIGEVHSEVFGVGAGIFVIGIAYMLFKIKLG